VLKSSNNRDTCAPAVYVSATTTDCLPHIVYVYTIIVSCYQVAELSSCIDVIVTWDQTAPHRPLHWLLFGKTLLMGTGGHVGAGNSSSSSGAGKASSSNSAPSAAEV
jgi:hypothetical protein